MNIHQSWVLGRNRMTSSTFERLLQAHDYEERYQDSGWEYLPEPTDHGLGALMADSNTLAAQEIGTGAYPPQDFSQSQEINTSTEAQGLGHQSHPTPASNPGFQGQQEPQLTVCTSQEQGYGQEQRSHWSRLVQDEPLLSGLGRQELPLVMQQSFGEAGDHLCQIPPPSCVTSAPIEESDMASTHNLLPNQAHTSFLPYPSHNAPPIQPDTKETLWYHGDATPNYSREASQAVTDLQCDDPCYAKLLYQALREQPNHMMTLKDLYDWVAGHTSKGKEGGGKGWQNSVRHNLSMNGAFERVNVDDASTSRKGMASYWRLTDEALAHGIISTTRYRKEPKHRKQRRGVPAPKRQESGAKGGQATRNATRLRYARQQQQLLQQARQYQRTNEHHHNLLPSHPLYSGFTSGPHHSNTSSPPVSMITSPPPQQITSYFSPDHDVSPLLPALLQPSNPHSPVDGLAQTPPDLPFAYEPPKSALGPFDYGELDAHNPFFGSLGDYTSLQAPTIMDDFEFVSGFSGL